MFSHTITEKLEVGNTLINKTTVQTAAATQSIEESFADATTDGLLAFTLDVSQCKSFYMVSTQDITIETNDGTTPGNTINLVAGVPYLWHADSYQAFLLTVDVTALYITNASGQTATLQIEVLFDPTV